MPWPSVPDPWHWYGSGSGSCSGPFSFRQWPSRWQTKVFLLCCRFVTFCFGSGSADLYHWVRIWILLFTSVAFKMSTKKYFSWFFCLFRFEGHSHHSSKIKRHKEVTKHYINQGFSYYFWLMIEGSVSSHLTNGSGSGRSKNLRIRIRIWNSASLCNAVLLGTFPLVSNPRKDRWR